MPRPLWLSQNTTQVCHEFPFVFKAQIKCSLLSHAGSLVCFLVSARIRLVQPTLSIRACHFRLVFNVVDPEPFFLFQPRAASATTTASPLYGGARPIHAHRETFVI